LEAQVPLRTFLIRVNRIYIKLTNNRDQLQAIAADRHPLLSMRESAHFRERVTGPHCSAPMSAKPRLTAGLLQTN
jgi:hypothetical protein